MSDVSEYDKIDCMAYCPACTHQLREGYNLGLKEQQQKIDELVKCVEAMVQDKKISAPETWYSKRARKCLEKHNGISTTEGK